MPKTTIENLSREQEGLRLTNAFINHCIGRDEKSCPFPRTVAIQEACLSYIDRICERCGIRVYGWKCGPGVNCHPCQIYAYRNDFKRFLDGKKTSFSKLVRREDEKQS